MAKKSIKHALTPILSKLKYRAVQSDKSRSPIYISSKAEDTELTPQERQALVSEARQLQRDFSLAAFCVRSHLQYVSYYKFRADTPDPDFNRKLTNKVKRWSHKSNCDIAGRRSFPELLYLIESCRVVDGDVGILKVNDKESGGKIQIIEGDRIRNSTDISPNPGETWIHGVRVNDNGKIIAFDVNKRKQYGGFEHERFISAKNMDLLGYYFRADSVRGISPLSSAIRQFKQVLDCVDVNLAKSRLEACLGLAVYLDEGSDLIEDISEQDTENRLDNIQSNAVDKFGEGVFTFYGTPNEKLEFISSNNPSSNFQDFITNVTRLVMLSLDLPYSFTDSSVSTFFGNKFSVSNYIDSVIQKQETTICWLNDLILDFLLPNWILNGDIELPSGYSIDELRDYVSWQGAGKPQWILLDSVKEMLVAIQAGLLPASEVVSDFGYSVRENLEDMGQLKEYADERGITLPFGNIETQNIGL